VHQVEESLSNRAHPLSWNFTCGDQKMLENPPEVEAKKSHQFFKDHYGADEMKMAGSKRLTVYIAATEKGLDQLRDIVVCVLQFLAILSKEGPQREYVKEKMKKAANDFGFGEKEDELEFAVGVCTSMFLDYERSSLLSSISNISGFDPEAITSFMAFLHADNMRLVVVSEKVEGAIEREK